ncbi:CPBP family intramembrane glutamic endopeptidase [Leptolyngbya sp. GGD]|uniref:CPBP family intramembrane glutamic endopeptidase n=1 Tax=Leptolyngbya sp. GGD TaxID=2997907 RepID=UPI00227CD928|nr:CPBP family intramembrane glutamic endopeptidase [Leptolyngbya sp. GGD]MCY6491999.1 CPBP family intramembrane metalloprotease [Leptolyngbya sp. GGD]
MKLNFANLAHRPTPIRIGLFLLMLLAIWLPVKLPIEWVISVLYGVNDAARNLASIVTLVILYLEFIVLVRVWSRAVYHENLFKTYGLRQPRQTVRDLLKGLAIGLGSLMLMFLLQGLLGLVQWQTPQSSFPRILLEGGVMAIAVGFAEELLFRGWLLNELDRDYSPRISLWVSSLIFAIVHGTRPQFFALVLLGVALVWAKRGTEGRLGRSIGLHAGLVWGYYLVNVGQLVKYTNHAPEWVTGIDRNPLAGLIGILALSAIAFSIKKASVRALR